MTKDQLNKAASIAKWLINAGFTKAGAAACCGNMYCESGFNSASEHWDVNGPSGGLCLWHDKKGLNGRLSKLKSFALGKGKNWTLIDVLLEYLMTEMYGGYKAVYNTMKTSNDVALCSFVWGDKFEVFAGHSERNGKEHTKRRTVSSEVYNGITSGNWEASADLAAYSGGGDNAAGGGDATGGGGGGISGAWSGALLLKNAYAIHEEYNTYSGKGGNIFENNEDNAYRLLLFRNKINNKGLDTALNTTQNKDSDGENEKDGKKKNIIHTRIYSTNDSCIVLDTLSIPLTQAVDENGNIITEYEEDYANLGVTDEDEKKLLEEIKNMKPSQEGKPIGEAKISNGGLMAVGSINIPVSGGGGGGGTDGGDEYSGGLEGDITSYGFDPAPYIFSSVPPYKGISTYDIRKLQIKPALSYQDLAKPKDSGTPLKSPPGTVKAGADKVTMSTLGGKCNNPCDISVSNFSVGVIGTTTAGDGQKAFGKFNSLVNGCASAMRLLRNKYSGKSIRGINDGFLGYFKANEGKSLSALRIVWITRACGLMNLSPFAVMDLNDKETMMAFVNVIAGIETSSKMGRATLEAAYKVAFG